MDILKSESSGPEPSGLQVERGTEPKHPRRKLWIVLAVVALTATASSVVLVAIAPPDTPPPTLSPTATPPSTAPEPAETAGQGIFSELTWSKNPLEVIVSPGESASRTLTLTSAQTIGGVTLVIEGAAATFVQIKTLNPAGTLNPTTPLLLNPQNSRRGRFR